MGERMNQVDTGRDGAMPVAPMPRPAMPARPGRGGQSSNGRRPVLDGRAGNGRRPEADARNGHGRLNEPPLWAPWYGIGFIAATVRFWRKGLTFSGRASRGEFWWSMLFVALMAVALTAVGTAIDGATQGTDGENDPATNAMTTIWQLATFLPGLSLTVRRLHDANHRGWWAMLPWLLSLASLLSVGSMAFMGDGDDALRLSVIALLAGVVLQLLGYALDVVMGVLPSNSAGARFDKAPSGEWPYGSDAGGSAAAVAADEK